MTTNQMNSFTKGPWTVNADRAQVDDASGLPICQLLWPTEERSEEETLSNAELIAAAPGLRSEIQHLRKRNAELVAQHHRDSAELRRLCAVRDEQRDGRLAALERAAVAESRIARVLEIVEEMAGWPADQIGPMAAINLHAAAAFLQGCDSNAAPSLDQQENHDV